MTTLYKRIITDLNNKNISYSLIRHKAVHTSKEAAAIRDGLSTSNGLKSLIISYATTQRHNFILIVLSGDSRIDNNKLKKLLSNHDNRFAKPKEVRNTVGAGIGAVPPCSFLFDKEIVMFIDLKSFENVNTVAFNPGRHDRTIILDKKNYIEWIKNDYKVCRIAD